MTDHRDGFPDGLLLEAAIPARLPWDANPEVPSGWDASDDARRDAAGDALRPDLPDADAGKSADLESGVLGPGDQRSDDSQSAVLAGSAGPCKPDAGPSAERSCAAPASADVPAQLAAPLQPDAVAELEFPLVQPEPQELTHSLVAEAQPGLWVPGAEVEPA